MLFESYAKDMHFVRIGYIPLEGRTVGGIVKDNLWSVSLLGRLQATGELAWDHRTSTEKTVSYLHFPLPGEMVREASERETTERQAKPFLDFVYEQFGNEISQRDVFTRAFIEELRQEDQQRVEDNFTVWGALDKESRIIGAWGLYLHQSGQYEGKYELVRLAAERRSDFGINHILPFVTEYLNTRKIDDGAILVRTDRFGRRLFLRYGVEQVGTYDQGRKFELEISISEFKRRYEAPEMYNGNRGIRYGFFLDEPFFY